MASLLYFVLVQQALGEESCASSQLSSFAESLSGPDRTMWPASSGPRAIFLTCFSARRHVSRDPMHRDDTEVIQQLPAATDSAQVVSVVTDNQTKKPHRFQLQEAVYTQCNLHK